MAESPGFLLGLAKAYRHLDAGPDVSTQEFAEACLAIMPIFDHLGILSFTTLQVLLDNGVPHLRGSVSSLTVRIPAYYRLASRTMVKYAEFMCTTLQSLSCFALCKGWPV